MSQSIVQVDAFTNEPFRGNPAAVCVLDAPREDAWMQAVALEMNLSETAYLIRENDGFRLRWFTPAAEVDLCGHATLASAHVLWEDQIVPDTDAILFHTRSGPITASRDDTWITVDFPLEREKAATVDGLEEALGVELLYTGTNRLSYCLAEVKTEKSLRELTPDFSALKKIPFHGFCVTSLSQDKDFDFVSRFFAPALGIEEDPVTGSAHCILASYWQGKLNKSTFNAYQASARGGVIRVKVVNDRAHIGGQAVTVLRGTLV